MYLIPVASPEQVSAGWQGIEGLEALERRIRLEPADRRAETLRAELEAAGIPQLEVDKLVLEDQIEQGYRRLERLVGAR